MNGGGTAVATGWRANELHHGWNHIAPMNPRGPQLLPLPDLPGKVHGIKSLDPCVVQCDGCGRTSTGPKVALTILTSDIIFCPKLRGKDDRRLCSSCRVEAGWPTR